jgi:rhomboid family GlyGly-CTERM serine protease
VAGLGLIWLLFGSLLSPSVWLFHIVWASLSVGLGLLCFDPNLGWYVGLSGVLHGLFVAGLFAEYGAQRKFAVLVFAVFSAKLVWEQVYGPLPGSERAAGGNVVVNAHLYGALGGLLGYAFLIAIRHFVLRMRSTR